MHQVRYYNYCLLHCYTVISTVSGNILDDYKLINIPMSNIGNVYIADSANCRIRKVTVSTGIISTIAGTGSASYSGDGGAATSATLYMPLGVAVDASGRILYYCLLHYYTVISAVSDIIFLITTNKLIFSCQT